MILAKIFRSDERILLCTYHLGNACVFDREEIFISILLNRFREVELHVTEEIRGVKEQKLAEKPRVVLFAASRMIWEPEELLVITWGTSPVFIVSIQELVEFFTKLPFETHRNCSKAFSADPLIYSSEVVFKVYLQMLVLHFLTLSFS